MFLIVFSPFFYFSLQLVSWTSEPGMAFYIGSKEAKSRFWLRPEDLQELPRQTAYGGFASGRASYTYQESDLLAAAHAKHGKATFEKKTAAREKRAAKKREREEASAAAAARGEPDPVAAKKKKQKLVPKKDYEDLNARTLGLADNVKRTWDVVLTKPLSFAGSTGTLTINNDYDGDISYMGALCQFGNFHGFASGCSEKDKSLKIETKWKVCGRRYSGSLSLEVAKDGTLRGKYNCGVPKSGSGAKVTQFVATLRG